jgi:hypothetical protein
MKDDERKLAEGVLQTLQQETDRLDGLMDEMLTEMEATAPESRSGDRWDDFTKRFLELQAAQRDVGEKLRCARSSLANEPKTKH